MAVPQVLCPVVVGRDAELAAIEEALDAVARGEGRTLVISGEAGVGKSRLSREVSTLAATRGLRVVCGRAVPSSMASPYRPLAEAVTQLLRGTAAAAAWLAAIDAGAAAASTVAHGETLLELFGNQAAGGLVVALEDLHWADPDTISVAEYVADNIADLPVLVVWTLRDGVRSPALAAARRLRGRPGVVQLPLERLDEAAVDRMIHACAGDVDVELLARIRYAAEGVPLLVEELLASPGLPASFADSVRERLGELDPQARAVIEAAAVLGRHFDGELLPAVCGAPPPIVADTLAAAVECLLISADGSGFRFRHALTRDAVLDTMLPPRQRAVAAQALAALKTAGASRETMIDVAIRAGDRRGAGELLCETGRDALSWGALATAVDALHQSVDLLDGIQQQAQAQLLLVEALALAGRVDEAATEVSRLIAAIGDRSEAQPLLADAHIRLAQAAVAAARWPLARHQLDEARRAAPPGAPPRVEAQMAVLEADVAFADDDVERARSLAEAVLALNGAPPDTSCHAWEIVGRAHRFHDLRQARDAFERALVTAESAGLPLWRLRALHELGTIDLLHHAGVDRLLEARAAAEAMGAMSTAATLDLQLAAGFTCRWDLDPCEQHAQGALQLARKFALRQVEAKAMILLAGSVSMRGDLVATDEWRTRATAAAPEDRMVEAFGTMFMGMGLLIRGDDERALDVWARGIASIGTLPHAEPAAARALWPLVLAWKGDRRAAAAIAEARRLGVGAFHLNQALVAYAEAVLAGRAGERRRADHLIERASAGFANCGAWADLAHVLAAPAALADGWGEPERWLTDARARFVALGLTDLVARCDALGAGSRPNAWPGAGLTAREADVLDLVVQGLANKEIAARLGVSPRTVEKHVESLLRKTGSRSRTDLAATTLSQRSARST